MMVKDPDAAPHCTSCGYNLHGLPRLRCPECGKEIESCRELEEARWLANRNAPDRQTALAERLATVLGAAMLIAGIGFIFSSNRYGYVGFIAATSGLGMTVTYLMIYTRHTIKEPLHLMLLILGSIWFVIGFCAWYAS